MRVQPTLSLITTVQDRRAHLACLISWLDRGRLHERWDAFELIVVEAGETPSHDDLCRQRNWITHVFVRGTGAFHKTALLNRGLELVRGTYLMPHDVDLLPAPGVLMRHLEAARRCEGVILAGYRVMLDDSLDITGGAPTPEAAFARAEQLAMEALPPEDSPSALRKYLLAGERFGVNPCFSTEVVRCLGGWDEAYVGWGAEDQDIMERVCASGHLLVRSYDLLYFHLHHGYGKSWKSSETTCENRRRLRGKRLARQPL